MSSFIVPGRRNQREETQQVAETRAEISVEDLAKYLAWSDRAMGTTASSSRFVTGADRYWEEASPSNRGKWIALAASLLGVADPREVRRGWGLDDAAEAE